jgi:hypothetical protein
MAVLGVLENIVRALENLVERGDAMSERIVGTGEAVSPGLAVEARGRLVIRAR